MRRWKQESFPYPWNYKLTRVTEGNQSGALKIAVPVVAAVHLIVDVHGIRGTCVESVWFRAIAAFVKLTAVDSTGSTAEINNRLQNFLRRVRLCHAPDSGYPPGVAAAAASTLRLVTKFCQRCIAATELAAQVYIVNLWPVTVEHPEVPFGWTAGLLVLVEEREDKQLNSVLISSLELTINLSFVWRLFQVYG